MPRNREVGWISRRAVERRDFQNLYQITWSDCSITRVFSNYEGFNIQNDIVSSRNYTNIMHHIPVTALTLPIMMDTLVTGGESEQLLEGVSLLIRWSRVHKQNHIQHLLGFLLSTSGEEYCLKCFEHSFHDARLRDYDLIWIWCSLSKLGPNS
ncbi:hypothetical protein ABKN59_011815 [Abortiporus biennis]